MMTPPDRASVGQAPGSLTCPVPGCCQHRSVGTLLCSAHAATVNPWLMRAADKALASYQTEPDPRCRPGRLDHLQHCNVLVIRAAQEAAPLLS